MSTDPTVHRTDSLQSDAVVKPVLTRRTKSAVGSDEQNQSGNDADSVDHELVNKTKQQIRNLVSEIADLAKKETPVDEFFEGFLNRTTSALACVGGAIWLAQPDSKVLDLQYHINLNNTSLATDQTAQMRHSMLLNKLREAGEPTLIPPHSGSSNTDQAGNPTEYLLIVGPLKIDQNVVGLVEILQRPGAGPTTQRGYLRFLTQTVSYTHLTLPTKA